MRTLRFLATWLTAQALLGVLGAAQAQTGAAPLTSAPNPAPGTTTGPAPAPAAAPSVVEPQVGRRDLKLPRYPSRDIEIGIFGGLYSKESFGTGGSSGLRLGYHITEDFFVTATYGRTKVSDENFRQVLPGGVFVNRTEPLTYTTVGIGWNLVPGEIFIGRNTAFLSQGYLLAAAGTTQLAGQRKQTIDVGFGLRLLLSQRFALQTEVRDHIYSFDLLGRRETTHNFEMTFGVSVFF